MQDQINTIRRHLSAATTAITLASDMLAPLEALVATPTAPHTPGTTLAKLLAELNHPDYTLRSLSELSEITGLDECDICPELEAAGALYVLKTRRSDDAQLIGLASRQPQEAPTEAAQSAPAAPSPKFQVGDKVRVVKRVTQEDGWRNTWADDMDDYVGKPRVFTIQSMGDHGERFAGVRFSEDNTFGWPLGALELVTDLPVPVATTSTLATLSATSKFNLLMIALETCQYSLRTIDQLVEKTGLADLEEVKAALEGEEIAFVLRRRRHDGAQMIGLASRN